METVSRIKNVETNTQNNSINNTDYTFEVVVIEDNHLTNTILSRALHSIINTIYSIKQIAVKFSSFQNGGEFLSYLENRESNDVKLIVFSDYYLEDNMNGGKILTKVKKKITDSTVVIMSDSPNTQIPIEAKKKGAYCFLPKSNKTPVICSEMLFQMVK